VPDVILVNPHYIRRHGGGVVPPIGLCYLAAVLRTQGASVEIVDLAACYPDFIAARRAEPLEHFANVLEALPSPPRLIGIGPLVTATLATTATLARAAREHGDAEIAIGGPLCAVPGAARELSGFVDCDWLVAGDGERPIAELFRGERSAGCAEGATRLGGDDPTPWREPTLDALPVPARDLLDHSRYGSSLRRNLAGAPMTSAFLSRGCPYSCSFCAAPLSSGKVVRRFSMPRVREELDACAALGFGEIVFYDDCLFVRSPKLDARVAEFAAAIEQSGWRGDYQLELRCDAVTAMADETLERLRASGCRQINMGIEKGHVAGLAAMRKRLTPETAQIATERVVEAGIRAAGTFILGGAGEGHEELEATVAFAESLDLDFAHFNPLALYPGTPLFAEQFPDRGDKWLQLCTNPDLAPFGDVLWRSEVLSLSDVLSKVEDAYSRFYDGRRLTRVLSRVPPRERDSVTASYARLRSERPASWHLERAGDPHPDRYAA
jgi:hypothetical protein